MSNLIFPSFSIVTVVYNDAEGLLCTGESLSTQNFDGFEWIIVDGGSTDGTLDVIKQYEMQSLKWLSEKDNGIYDAMNKGISMCTGEFVVFLNAGDVFESNNTLSNVIDNIQQNCSRPDVLFCGANLSFKNRKIIYRSTKRIENYIWHGLPANHQATFFKRSLLSSKSYSDKYILVGDYFLVADLFNKGVNCQYLDESVVRFSIGGFSHQNPLLALKEAYQIQKNVLDILLPFRILSAFKRLTSIMLVSLIYKFN